MSASTPPKATSNSPRAFAETRSWAEVMDNLLTLYAKILHTPTLAIDPEMDPDDFDLEPLTA